jgi:putative cell division protein ftsQ
MRIHWKKTLVITTDILLAGYLVLAFTAFNKPDESQRLCTQVNIDIQDEATNGFINAQEIKRRLEKEHLYPLSQPMRKVNLREIEELLKASPFVKTAECYKTEGGAVNITLTQRMPVVRVKASNGDDYYLDDKDCVMPNSHYTSDLIIATGDISKSFATHYLSPMSKAIMANPLWSNQIEQINVLPDKTIELVPRVGNHIIGLGTIPYNKYKSKQNAIVTAFIEKKLSRLEKFYRYGLSQAGWNRYSYINLAFDNQIICKRRDGKPTREEDDLHTLSESDVIGNVPETNEERTSTEKTETKEKSKVSTPEKPKKEEVKSKKDEKPKEKKTEKPQHAEKTTKEKTSTHTADKPKVRTKDKDKEKTSHTKSETQKEKTKKH